MNDRDGRSFAGRALQKDIFSTTQGILQVSHSKQGRTDLLTCEEVRVMARVVFKFFEVNVKEEDVTLLL